jgi:hypothetical protein
MNFRAALVMAMGVVALQACGFREKPTRLDVPEGAIEPRYFRFALGRAHQTSFTLREQYPNNSALEHYAKALPEPWVRCDWVPEWASFLDATVTPIRTVHQQLHVWINREARRSLMLSMSYYSPSDCAPEPLNDEQVVIVLEHTGVSVDTEIRRLDLKCPGRAIRPVNSASIPETHNAPKRDC